MTGDIFYSILKLTSGEEILARVCGFVENDEVMIVLDHPIIVNIIVSPKLKTPFVKVLPWMSLTNETTYIIRRKDVLAMTEVKDVNLALIHKKYVEETSTGFYPSSSERRRESVLRVDEARNIFERIYNSQNSSTASD